jgi:uncharacterized protein (TIGR00730 family)
MIERRVVSVFGGSLLERESAAYLAAERLGRLLAEAGFALATGGYVGTMEAVSKGASEVGVRVIGVTSDDIEAWRDVRVNSWVTERVHCGTLLERMQRLIEIGQALVALPGGIGTLAEIAVAWSLIQTSAISPRPLILVGDAWQKTLARFIELTSDYVRPGDREHLTFCESVDDVVARLVST